MKNLILTACAVLALCASCSKQNTEIIESMKGSIVNVSFAEETSTRAFFGSTAAAENWEKALNTITMFVFNSSSGNLIVQRAFSSDELTSRKASFVLPDIASGTSCDFYAVANLSPAGITNKASLLSTLETAAAQYNGTFAEVTAGAKRTGGFVLSGSKTQSVAAAGATTNVEITLKRTVAKVAVEITHSPAFNNLYPGIVKVNSVTVKKAASQTPIIKPVSPTPGTMNFTFSQNSNAVSGKYQNLFYLFENGALSAGNRVVLTINATYDADRNFSTTTDQMPITYEMELSGDGVTGAISRNGYYRVAITLTGLAGSSAGMTVIVSEWEVPSTQTINIGM